MTAWGELAALPEGQGAWRRWVEALEAARGAEREKGIEVLSAVRWETTRMAPRDWVERGDDRARCATSILVDGRWTKKKLIARLEREVLEHVVEVSWMDVPSAGFLGALTESALWDRLEHLEIAQHAARQGRTKPLGAKAAQPLLKAGRGGLKSLRLIHLGLGDAACARLLEGPMPALRWLALPGNGVGRATAARVAALVVESLDLSDGAMKATTLKVLAGSTTLRVLRLDQARVTDAGAKHLHGLALRELYLHENRLGDEAILALGAALGETLEVLHAWQNPVSEAGAKRFVKAASPVLRELRLPWVEWAAPRAAEVEESRPLDELLAEVGLGSSTLHRVGARGPWEQGSPEEVACAAFGPLADEIPALMARLAEARSVHVMEHEGESYLLYDLETELLAGGVPQPDPEPEEGWRLPSSLRALLARHDGFGRPTVEHGRLVFDPGVMPSWGIVVPEVPGAKDLLRFGRGWGEAGEGGWCFAGKRKQAIVDVEDRYGGRSEPFDGGFFRFVEALLLDEELPFAERF